MKKGGYNLIEVLIAIAIISMVVVAFLQGLNIGIGGTYSDTQKNDALHLAQSQMEYIKSQPYEDNCEYTPLDDNVTISCINESVEDLQHIMVTVYFDDNRTVTIEGYKTNRYD